MTCAKLFQGIPCQHSNGTIGSLVNLSKLSEVGAALNQNGVRTEMFWVGRGPMIGCLGCGACCKTKRCFYDKDSVNGFLDKAGQFDGFVFGSPVHFATISGTMKFFMGRAFFNTLHDNPFQGKIAATVVSARRSGTTSALDQLNKYPVHRGMPLASYQYWPKTMPPSDHSAGTMDGSSSRTFGLQRSAPCPARSS